MFSLRSYYVLRLSTKTFENLSIYSPNTYVIVFENVLIAFFIPNNIKFQ